MTSDAFIGIDIGGTKIATALSTREGRVVGLRRLPTRVERGPEAILDELVRHLKSVCDEAGVRPLAVGVGCPGQPDRERGLIMSPVNLPGWDEFPVFASLEKRLGAPVAFDNDANLAALGEHAYGAARGLEDIFYLTISTGVGGAVIVNNRLVRGLSAGAGELGHYTIEPEGPLCGCGARGCLNVLCSGPAIVRRARQRLARGDQAALASPLARHAELTAKEVAEAAADGDPLAREVWDETIHYLSMGISATIAVLAPQAVIVGGGVAQTGALLLDPLRESVRARVRNVPAELIRIEAAALGPDSGVYGALELARQTLPPHQTRTPR